MMLSPVLSRATSQCYFITTAWRQQLLWLIMTLRQSNTDGQIYITLVFGRTVLSVTILFLYLHHLVFHRYWNFKQNTEISAYLLLLNVRYQYWVKAKAFGSRYVNTLVAKPLLPFPLFLNSVLSFLFRVLAQYYRKANFHCESNMFFCDFRSNFDFFTEIRNFWTNIS